MNGEVNLQQYLKFLPTYDSDKCNATIHYPGFITKHNICTGLTDTDKGPCYVSLILENNNLENNAITFS